MLGTFVVLYLFLGGAGAGALFVAAVWSLLFHRTVTRTFEQSRAFRALAGRLYLVGFGLLALSVFCLLIDLGSPHRFFLLFLRPTASLLSVGSFVLLATLLASASWPRSTPSAGPLPFGCARGWKCSARCWRRCSWCTPACTWRGWRRCPFGITRPFRLCSLFRRSPRERRLCFCSCPIRAIGRF